MCYIGVYISLVGVDVCNMCNLACKLLCGQTTNILRVNTCGTVLSQPFFFETLKCSAMYQQTTLEDFYFCSCATNVGTVYHLFLYRFVAGIMTLVFSLDRNFCINSCGYQLCGFITHK